MPRAPRVQFAGAFYHVYHRGNRRQPIFLDDQDYARFETFMLEAMNRSGVRLYTWKQMPNHFHLLVQTPDGNLAEFMQRLLTRYAMYFNWRHHQVGHLFQGRYSARLCDKEAYFMALIRYIELNAYRTRGRSLAKPGEWKWSSHRYLMMPESQWPDGLQMAFREVLGRFSEDPQRARRVYAEYLADGLKNGTWKSFYKPKADRFLGDDAFVETCKRRAGEAVRQSPRSLRRWEGPNALLEKVARLSGLTAEELTVAGQKQVSSRWRQAFAYVGRRHYRCSVKDLARAIGRHENTVSQMLTRMEPALDRIEVQALLNLLERPTCQM